MQDFSLTIENVDMSDGDTYRSHVEVEVVDANNRNFFSPAIALVVYGEWLITDV